VKASRRIAQSLRRLAESTEGVDEQAWAVFIGDAYGLLRLAAARILRDELLAEDAVQETLLTIWDQIERGRIDPTASDQALLNWCYTVAANRARRLRAAERRRRQAPLEDTAEWDSVEAEPAAADEAVLGRLRSAVGQLPERQRTVVELRYAGHCDNRTIAERMGLAPSAVALLAHRALDQLRRRLGTHTGQSAVATVLVTELLRQGYGAQLLSGAVPVGAVASAPAAPAVSATAGAAGGVATKGILLGVLSLGGLTAATVGWWQWSGATSEDATQPPAVATESQSVLGLTVAARSQDPEAFTLRPGYDEQYQRRVVSRDALRITPHGPARELDLAAWGWTSNDAGIAFGEQRHLAWTTGSATGIVHLRGPMEQILAEAPLRIAVRLNLPKARYVNFFASGIASPAVREIFPSMANVFRKGAERPTVSLRTNERIDSEYNYLPVGDFGDGRVLYECWPELPLAGCELMTSPSSPTSLHMRQTQVRLVGVSIQPLRVERIQP
jgi:RNA polymerase sigma-70 factor (ECF subfamily)